MMGRVPTKMEPRQPFSSTGNHRKSVIDLSDSAAIGCPHLPHWNTRCPLASHMVFSGASSTSWYRNPKSLPHSISVGDTRCQHLLRGSRCLVVACLRRAITFPSPPQTSPTRDFALKGPNLRIQRHGKVFPDWTHKGTEKIVSGGHTVELPYEFLLPCLCIEASYLQEDTVRRKKCPFQRWPEAYGSDFWKSVHFTDYSQHTQMVMALTLRCPLKLEAALCQRQDWHTLCKDLPNATARESDGWYVLEKVDLHPQLCFKFSFGNSSHVECPHQTGSLTSWNVSMDTQAQQLILHFSSRMHATFSAAWSRPGLGQDTLVPPVYTVSQARGSSPVTLDLIIPFLRPGRCVLVWRSDVQFAWKHLLCPDVSFRRLGLLILALLALLSLLGVVLALTCRRPQSGPGPARPVLLLHAADSEAQRRLVGALAELLRAALGDGRDVIVDLWEGRHVARVGPLPWLWAARARVAREQGTVLLLWSSACLRPARGPDPRATPLLALLHAAPRPLLLAYFSRLCTKGDIPPPLRALPRYRLLRDLPRLLRALEARPSAEATSWGRLGARQRRPSRLELCSLLEREAARLDLG
ncbi:PREDICTED: interleukin-17 receptor E isoform X6 [Cercocebus atys]|uniref:interleukin-17 receptor E isoform X6 n=1 Tax=Cercocebus atys TaxID=9531 RepID=UPI0005F4FED4|nr:PREDICTED: interleukin-17 receptor E isoform X6 [Cercocebus atys]